MMRVCLVERKGGCGSYPGDMLDIYLYHRIKGYQEISNSRLFFVIMIAK
jgi:hypothetical protein